MTTVSDVKSAWSKMKDFLDTEHYRTRTLDVNELSREGLRKVLEMFRTGKFSKRKANRLFREIRNQICVDQGISSRSFSSLTDNLKISKAAEEKLQAFRSFVEKTWSLPP